MSPLEIRCPACNAGPGQKCSAPTDTGRRDVEWVHHAREDAASQGGTEAPVVIPALPTSVRNDSLNEPIVGLQPHDPVWSTDALRAEFEVLTFLAPFVEVRRRSDGALGSMQFQPSPRYYFAFVSEG